MVARSFPQVEAHLMPLPLDDRTVAPRRRGKTATIQLPLTDIRSVKVREFLNASGFERNTRRNYERELYRFLSWSELLWSEIKPHHLNAHYLWYLTEEVRTSQGNLLSTSSRNLAVMALRSFFAWLHKTYPDLVFTNPAIGLKGKAIPLPEAQSLTEEQQASVWNAVAQRGETQLRDRALVHILSHGLRAGEVVDLNMGAIGNHTTDGVSGKVLFIANTKTDRPRIVPLDPASWAEIESYLNWRRSQGEELSCDRPLLLSHHVTRRGERLTYHGIYFAIEKIGELAEIQHLHPHLFRHTYLTELLLDDIDPAHARRLGGIESESVFRRYTLRAEQEAAINAFFRNCQKRLRSLGTSGSNNALSFPPSQLENQVQTERLEIARKLLREGVTLEVVARSLDLSFQILQDLQHAEDLV
ncbi:tyrosine-type recombinase/integrase [Leptolyngbya sp. NIES-2104]|uniref:tyrosine-type recombinase/integrase n=1 Tax=Leptolyngbya sp. NIES-2104 TaxID=1552121 RepID=UPI0006ECA621|nr:tyrosine-type recombinase/integrase [Leptolyngbya sp. NIES-2104]GAP99566.1 integrase/recombinase XerD [Leptolyngbya sp. NIES-2104]